MPMEIGVTSFAATLDGLSAGRAEMERA